MSNVSKRFPRSACKRFAELLLRRIHQDGGRERYVRVADLEDALGLEEELILELCRTRLFGEVHVTFRLNSELAESLEYSSALERQWATRWYAEPHVRIRPASVRLTQKELVGRPRKKRG